MEGPRTLYRPARGSGGRQFGRPVAPPDGGEAVCPDEGLPEWQGGEAEKGKGGRAADQVIVQRRPGGQDFRISQQLPELPRCKMVQHMVGNNDVEPGTFTEKVTAVRLPEFDAGQGRALAGKTGGAGIGIYAGDLQGLTVACGAPGQHHGEITAARSDVEDRYRPRLRRVDGPNLPGIQRLPAGQ